MWLKERFDLFDVCPNVTPIELFDNAKEACGRTNLEQGAAIGQQSHATLGATLITRKERIEG